MNILKIGVLATVILLNGVVYCESQAQINPMGAIYFQNQYQGNPAMAS